ncbi:MAG TPA: histidine kinase [Actinoplanes sp.]
MEAATARGGPFSHRHARAVARFTTRPMPIVVWILLWIAVAAADIAMLLPLFADGRMPPLYLVLVLVVGSFLVCGLIAWRRRPDNRSGQLMTATGFAFFASPLLSQLPWAVPRTLAYWLPDLWLLFFVPLLLTFRTGGRLRTRTDVAIAAVLAVTILVPPPLMLMFSPAPGNVLLVAAHPEVAGAIAIAQRVLFLGVLLSTVAVIAVRFRAASRPRRRALLPAVAGAACLLLFAAATVRHLLLGNRFIIAAEALDWIVALSIAVVPLAFLTGLLRSRLARGGLAGLFRTLRDLEPAQLEPALARAMGDPSLAVAYRRPDGSYADAHGTVVTLPAPGGERAVATVEAAGAPSAALVYDRSLDDDAELVDAVRAAATIALEHRHLEDEARARMSELRASRQRLVAAGDAERRRIERNLHDGAQARLVALGLQLSRIQRRIRADPAEAEELATSASDELARSLTELRELARGIRPSALDHGLDVALEALAVRSAVPTAVTVEPGPPLPEATAFAAYLVTSEALANVAKHARAGTASVRVIRRNGRVVLEILDDGVGGADPCRGTGLRGLTDRVEALGGSLRVRNGRTGGTIVSADLPDAD